MGFFCIEWYENTNAIDVEHNIIEPYATNENVKGFRQLQKFQSIGLVVAVGEEYMYFQLMNSKSVNSQLWDIIIGDE